MAPAEDDIEPQFALTLESLTAKVSLFLLVAAAPGPGRNFITILDLVTNWKDDQRQTTPTITGTSMRITADLLEDRVREIVDRMSPDEVTGGDQTCIEIAVSGFVRANFYPRFPGSTALPVTNLPRLVEAAITQFCRSIIMPSAAIDSVCIELATFINAGFQKKEYKPWRKVGRGWN